MGGALQRLVGTGVGDSSGSGQIGLVFGDEWRNAEAIANFLAAQPIFAADFRDRSYGFRRPAMSSKRSYVVSHRWFW